ncbi:MULTISPECIES: hypothetical protein [Corynebacterium]|nr:MULTISPECIES: hypothetical protein [Corynebacterium]MCG7279658.1 hypothetical protein [Corynebacterium imitans]MDK8307448.1 hypothetical protein [Corynebacterium imitans]MDK8638538.1 hypothetical protein [Corynebacterium imitans]MDK8773757.1 hypothetical protein [Corynebacterium imitans]
MDIGAMLDPLVQFFSGGIGKSIADVMTFLYELFFPANAEAAAPVEIPK